MRRVDTKLTRSLPALGSSLPGDASHRLFVALRLPPSWAAALAVWQDGAFGAVAGVRIVPPEQLHITLAFLGERPAGELPLIAGAVREAATAVVGPLRLTPARYCETRSVGLLVLDDKAGAAAALAGAVQGRLASLGVYRQERGSWLPHVTVLRFRARPELRPGVPPIGPCLPSDAALYHSSLRSGGAQYVIVDSVALGGTH